MTVKHECSGKAYDVTGFHRCFRNATVQRDGKWYCWQHDPEYVAKKAAERRASWQAKMDREAAKYTRIARNARLAALVTPKLAALLERLSTWDVLVLRTTTERDYARTLAARIREALALEASDEG